MSKIRVLLIDDHDLFREGLARILDSQIDFEVVGEGTNGLEAFREAEKLKPDLILMDANMPICDGLEATKRIKREYPETTIVMLTVSDEDEQLFEAIRNGAQGYLLKNIRRDEMLSLLRGAMRGEAAITPALGGRMLEEFRRIGKQPALDPADQCVLLSAREQEVLVLAAGGASNQEIAEKLSISINTVRSHMRKILSKLQLTNRREASLFARREGLIPPSNQSEK